MQRRFPNSAMNRRLFLLLTVFAVKRRRRRKPGISHLALPVLPAQALSPVERGQLLRSFRDSEIEAELRHRLLSLFSLEEIQAEGSRRGIT